MKEKFIEEKFSEKNAYASFMLGRIICVSMGGNTQTYEHDIKYEESGDGVNWCFKLAEAVNPISVCSLAVALAGLSIKPYIGTSIMNLIRMLKSEFMDREALRDEVAAIDPELAEIVDYLPVIRDHVYKNQQKNSGDSDSVGHC